ncbi:pectinesterase inhibitor 6-like [Mercurialis annua]|uniref:pectinesterase inhibitor 6-like n=1 Tax=Mercurialis annua TaxID=3986 RepID=UPI00215FADDD|nr:pectinesterase inhibitor 6-like [Mercurialis annua]
MRPPYIFIFFLFLSWAATNTTSKSSGDTYVREACSVTRYQNLCIRSLSSFSQLAKKNPSIWARAGVSVTITDSKNITQFLKNLNKNKAMKGKNKLALSDCIECFLDAIDNLHKSLGVLRNLDSAKFDDQMSDVITWLSAALTDEETCLDGFQEQNDITKQVRVVLNRVSRTSYITSNALALANNLASTGLGSFIN